MISLEKFGFVQRFIFKKWDFSKFVFFFPILLSKDFEIMRDRIMITVYCILFLISFDRFYSILNDSREFMGYIEDTHYFLESGQTKISFVKLGALLWVPIDRFRQSKMKVVWNNLKMEVRLRVLLPHFECPHFLEKNYSFWWVFCEFDHFCPQTTKGPKYYEIKISKTDLP